MPACKRCSGEIYFRRVADVVKAFDSETGELHHCGGDVYDLPQQKRLNIFNPKDGKYSKYQRGR